MRDSILKFLAQCAIRRPWAVIISAVLIAVLSAIYAAISLKMNANTDDLIAKDRPYMKDYAAFIEEFGDLEPIICVVAPKDGTSADETHRCLDSLIQEIGEIDGIQRVNGRINPEEQQRLAFWAMNEDELGGLTLAAEGIGKIRSGEQAGALVRYATKELNKVPNTLIPSKQMERGASAIFVLQSIASIVPQTISQRETKELTTPPQTEYLRSPTGKLYFIEIMPAKDYGTLAVIEKPLAAIRASLTETRKAFPTIEMGLTGKPVLQADEMATTDSDMTKSSIVAVIAVALMFMLIIGGIRRPLLAVIALLIAIGWTFGLTTLVVGQLNLLSIVFTLILVGIGIDFGVHVVARYKEERAKSPLNEALTSALLTAGRGNITGAVTSSLAFFMAILTDFQGLQELGFIGGTGLLLCLLSMMFVLPALLVVFDKDNDVVAIDRSPSGGGWRDRVPARTALILLIVATVLCLRFATDVGFNGNVLELQAKGLDSIRWEHRVLDDSSATTWFGAAVANDLSEVEALVAKTKSEPAIGSVVSVLDFVKPQTEKRTQLVDRLKRKAAKKTAAESAELSTEDLIASAKSLGRLQKLAEAADKDAAERLRDLRMAILRLAKTWRDSNNPAAKAKSQQSIALALEQTSKTFDTMFKGVQAPLAEILPAAIRHRLISPNGKYLVSMHPKEDVWDVPAMERYVTAMEHVDPNVTGVPLTHLNSIYDMRIGFAKAALYALIAVLVLVLIDFKSLTSTLLAILPLVTGAIWLAIAMGILGLDFNLANFFAVPILIGLGVDNGIHLVHRWREDPSELKRFGSTQRGVLLTSLTSMIGFGCLSFATHKGLMSLGLLMALGCAASLASSLIILPLVLALREKTSGS